MWPYVRNEDDRKVVEVVISQQAFERPYFMAPRTDAGLVALLRAAFENTMQDAQFAADAEKAGIDVSPLPGAEVEDLVRKLYATPKSVLERAKWAIRP
jgi:tripartite-type tricarboxylate transporter receptor subunit TctC